MCIRDSLSAGGTAVIGLGHGIRNDSVASHPFFGTVRVIDALKDCPGFSEGRVDLLDGAYVRAAGNRYVSAIDPDRVVGPMASRTVPTMMAVEAPLVAAVVFMLATWAWTVLRGLALAAA